MNTKYHDLIVKAESEIRNGRASVAVHLLHGINMARIPRELRLPLGNLCRRIGLTRQGLRILGSVIKPIRRQSMESATAAEIAEYAILILRNGSPDEALKLLKDSNQRNDSVSESLLYGGFCHMVKWDGESAIPLFKKFIETTTNEYQLQVAKVNLISALLSSDLPYEALAVIDNLIPEIKEKKYKRLLANALELRVHAHIQLGDLVACERDLNEADEIMRGEKSLDQLFILKWKAIIQSMNTKQISPLVNFRKEAEKRCHWESVRECDFYSLKIEFDENLFERLYFGTPHISYRARLEKHFKMRPAKSLLLFGERGGAVLDLETGIIENGSVQLKPGGKNHLTMQSLCKDFYRPSSMGHLFGSIFNGEYFDPFSSVGRVHQTLLRSREWIQDGGYPIEVNEVDGSYRLLFHGPFAFRVKNEDQLTDRKEALLSTLKRLFKSSEKFSCDQICSALNTSRSTVHRFVTWALESGHLAKVAISRRQFYEFRNEKLLGSVQF